MASIPFSCVNLCFALDKDFFLWRRKSRILSVFVTCCLGVSSPLDQSSVRFIICDFLFTFIDENICFATCWITTGSHILLYSIINSKSGFLCLGFQFLYLSFFICKIRVIIFSYFQRQGTNKLSWHETKPKWNKTKQVKNKLTKNPPRQRKIQNIRKR